MLEDVQEIRVKVSRWESRRLWWRAGTRAPGLVLHIEGYSTPTQTYRTRDLDRARAMVLDYLDRRLSRCRFLVAQRRAPDTGTRPAGRGSRLRAPKFLSCSVAPLPPPRSSARPLAHPTARAESKTTGFCNILLCSTAPGRLHPAHQCAGGRGDTGKRSRRCLVSPTAAATAAQHRKKSALTPDTEKLSTHPAVVMPPRDDAKRGHRIDRVDQCPCRSLITPPYVCRRSEGCRSRYLSPKDCVPP